MCVSNLSMKQIELFDATGQSQSAGSFHLLGGEKEMPWAYERLFKYDVTDVVRKHGISTEVPVKVRKWILKLKSLTKQLLPSHWCL